MPVREEVAGERFVLKSYGRFAFTSYALLTIESVETRKFLWDHDRTKNDRIVQKYVRYERYIGMRYAILYYVSLIKIFCTEMLCEIMNFNFIKLIGRKITYQQ